MKTYKQLNRQLTKLINEAQKYNSKGTSLNQIAAGFKKIDWKPGTYNLDYGGGKYEKATLWLLEQGVTNLVYDEYNRSPEHNKEVLSFADEYAESTTCFNVLNVIKEKKYRKQVIKNCKRKNTKAIYFSVYEGDKSGEGRQTRNNDYQNNKRLSEYLDEVKSVYSSATMKKGMIIVNL